MFNFNKRSDFLQNIFEIDNKLMEKMEENMIKDMKDFGQFTKELANKMKEAKNKIADISKNDKNFSSTKVAINLITKDKKLRDDLVKQMEKISGMKIKKSDDQIIGLLEKENGKAVNIDYNDPFFKGLANNAIKEIKGK